MSKEKRPVGRPLKFKTAQELQRRINGYFKSCDPHIVTRKMVVYPLVKVGKRWEYDYNQEPSIVKRKVMSEQVPYTITGLALYLGTTRETLIDYESRDEFSDTIKAAKSRCEEFAERLLFIGKATGPIFNLKNNYGWKDAKQLDGTVTVEKGEFEDLSDTELKSRINEAMKNLGSSDSE